MLNKKRRIIEINEGLIIICINAPALEGNTYSAFKIFSPID